LRLEVILKNILSNILWFWSAYTPFNRFCCYWSFRNCISGI